MEGGGLTDRVQAEETLMSEAQETQAGKQTLGQELLTFLQLAFSQPRLSIMMFLEYAIWGAWAPALAGYLEAKLGFAGLGLGIIYAAFPVANLLTPFTGGQVADRWLPTQVALGIFHLLGGGVLVLMAFTQTLPPMLALMLLYCLLFAPTLALTNSLAFHHLRNPERDFGPIRVWGTIGWIVANWVLSFMRTQFGTGEWPFFDAFVLGGVLALVMGLFSFLLPHTPPAREGVDPLAFREALVLLRNPSYLTFFIIAFIVATELQLYYVLTFPYLQTIGPKVGITSANLPAWMTIAQIAEIFTMWLLLPYALPRWGVRVSLLIGILAWPIRYFVFSLVWPAYLDAPGLIWLAVAALALHGFCYVFFFTVAFIYTDMVAPRDIRASAQSLINVAVLGVGLFIGSLFAGWLKDVATAKPTAPRDALLAALFAKEATVEELAKALKSSPTEVEANLGQLQKEGSVAAPTGAPPRYRLTEAGERHCIETRLVTNYRLVFSVPVVITVLCALAFAFFFRENRREAA